MISKGGLQRGCGGYTELQAVTGVTRDHKGLLEGKVGNRTEHNRTENITENMGQKTRNKKNKRNRRTRELGEQGK